MKIDIESGIKSKRGQLTKNLIDNLCEIYDCTDDEITKDHLRFLPYLGYILMNEKKIDMRKINSQELNIFNF